MILGRRPARAKAAAAVLTLDAEGPATEPPPAARAAPIATTSRPSAARRRAPYAFGLALFTAGATPIVAYAGKLGFAPLIAFVGLLGLPLLGRRRAASLPMAFLFLLLVFAVVSVSWSPAAPVRPDFTRYKTVEALTPLKLVLQFALYGAFVVAMGRLSAREASTATLGLGIGLAAISALVAVDAVQGAGVYAWWKGKAHIATSDFISRRNVGLTTYTVAVLFWPVALRLYRTRLRALAFVTATCALGVALVWNVDAPIAAALASAPVFALVRWRPRWAFALMAAAIVLYFAATPVLLAYLAHVTPTHDAPGGVGKASWAVRMDIWRFSTARIFERPFLGWGLDASRCWPARIWLHTHDAALQLWLELGAVGAALAALFWLAVLEAIWRAEPVDRTMAAASAATAAAYLAIGAISFGVWQEWWLALGALAAFVCRATAASRGADRGLQRLLDRQVLGLSTTTQLTPL